MTLKFAVVREDPLLESRLVAAGSAREVLTVASGGCTALTLLARHPALRVTAFDLNPAQLAHVRAKSFAAQESLLADLNVNDDRRDGLNQRGEFEGLFRVLRGYLDEFVFKRGEVARFFTSPDDGPALAARWTSHPYWSAAFELAFHEALLHAMFGPAATQHAERGSYPGYFRDAFTRGLGRPDAASNPFLQHVLWGRYRDPPPYVGASVDKRLSLRHGSLLEVPELSRFELISLSNIFDWSDDALVRAWASHLAENVQKGARVLIRQLNNLRDLRPHFEGAFLFDDALGAALLAEDRSLFYNRIEVAVRA